MKFSIILVSTFLSWAAYDHNLFRRKNDSYVFSEDEIVSLEKVGQKKRALLKREHLSVIPAWHKARKKPTRLKCNYFSTSSRDVRNSDQRKIRRRFNNA